MLDVERVVCKRLYFSSECRVVLREYRVEPGQTEAVSFNLEMGSEAPIRCDGCGIAQFTVLRTFPHNLLFSAHFRIFCNFSHISA